MCGRLNVIDDPWIQQLCFNLGINLSNTQLQNNRFVSAANQLQIIKQTADHQRVVTNATWWLLLDQTEQGFRPSKYTSFNTRYDKLHVRNSAGYIPYRQSRCIVAAKGWGETRSAKINNKIHKQYFDFEAENAAITFGGLYKEYIHHVTGKVMTACSIITLPPHPLTEKYHPKSNPLILPQDSTLDDWLNPNIKEVEQFEKLLSPIIPDNLIVTEINKPSEFIPIGKPKLVHA